MTSGDVSESSMDARLVDDAVEAIRAGRPVVLPTDTVYGLCTKPDAVAALAALKGRDARQPIALLAADVDALLAHVPGLATHSERIRALLPGRLTLILPLAESEPDRIGVRVPELRGEAREIVRRVGVVAATSANLHGGPDPKRLEDVPREIRDAAVLVDGGELPGVPSTVVDLTGPEPVILREGAVPAEQVLGRLAEAASDRD
jgi:L-threonylcarbamoyladenylate synthase